MKRYSASEARQHFSQILLFVEKGENVAITKHGAPIAVISRVKRTKVAPPGWASKKGWSITLTDDFDGIPEGFEDYV